MSSSAITLAALMISLLLHLLILLLPHTAPTSAVNLQPRELLPVRLIAPPEQPGRKPAIDSHTIKSPPAPASVSPIPQLPRTVQQTPLHPAVAAVTQPPLPAAVSATQQVRQPAQPAAAKGDPARTEPLQKPAVAAAAAPAAARRGDYLTLVRNQVERNKEYPSFSRQTGQKGTVLVKVVIREDGGTEEISITQTSGHRQLDKAALTAVKNAAPFKAPTQFGLQRISIEIPIVYKLN
jgi:periplasmic protein TonB